MIEDDVVKCPSYYFFAQAKEEYILYVIRLLSACSK